MRGLVIGVLALTGLYLISTSGASRLGAALTVPTGWLTTWLDPSVPLIKARAGAPSTTSTTSTAPHPRSGPAPATGGQIYNPQLPIGGAR